MIFKISSSLPPLIAPRKFQTIQSINVFPTALVYTLDVVFAFPLDCFLRTAERFAADIIKRRVHTTIGKNRRFHWIGPLLRVVLYLSYLN